VLPLTTGTPRSGGFGSGELPSHRVSGWHCTQILVDPTRGSTTILRSVPATSPPTRHRWRPLHQPDSRLALEMTMRIAPLLGEAPHQPPPPLAPGHAPEQLNLKGLPAHLTSLSDARQPPPDEQPSGLGHRPLRGQGRRPPN
jgi:hypothetical protein